jgi:PAS domain S-box-containing protein
MPDSELREYLNAAEERLSAFQRRYADEVPFSARPLFDEILGELGVALWQLRISSEAEARAALLGTRERQTPGEREAYFEALVANAPEIVTVLEADGSVRFESPAVEPALGWKQDELVGRNAFDLVHLDDLPTVMQAVGRARNDPAAFVEVRFRFRHRDGSWRPLDAVGRFVPDPKSEGWYLVHSRPTELTARAMRR